jgi:hypothetical protein
MALVLPYSVHVHAFVLKGCNVGRRGTFSRQKWTLSRVHIKEGMKWQREIKVTRGIRIKEAVNNPAAKAEAKRVVSRQVAAAVAAAKAADNAAVVVAAGESKR